MAGGADIRLLRQDGVERLISWAATEGWNPGLADAAAFHAADPEGFLGAFVNDEMVAGISAMRYGADFGFIGLYICRPDWRGKGYGKAVWDAAMQRLEGRIVGLDGVPEQQQNYASMGFRAVYQTRRWSGVFPGSFSTPDAAIVDAARLPLSAVAEFDRSGFFAPRLAFLEAWLSVPHKARACTRAGKIVGYGVVRRCLDGFKIGPLFAETVEDAHALMQDLARGCEEQVFHLDIPDTASSFVRLLVSNGFQPGFATARMYRGDPPVVQQSWVQAVTSLELG